MNAEQKRAWLAVGTGIACLIGYLALLPFLGPRVAFAAFGLFGINGFAPLIGRREKMDERDASIARRATLAGGMASYLAFVLGCMAVWFVAFAWHRQEQVSVHLFPTITIAGAVVFYFFRGLTMLALYRRHMEADHA